MNGGFHFPLLDFIRSFGIDSFRSIVLFCIPPLVIGVLIGHFSKRRSGIIWACATGVVTVIITILYQYGRTYHLLDRLGLVLGPVFTLLFLGVILGIVGRSFLKNGDE